MVKHIFFLYNRIRLEINDKEEGSSATAADFTIENIYLGGSPNQIDRDRVPTNDKLHGCISDVIANKK